MRNLNPVAAHETFVARGTYRRFQGDQQTAYIESWTLHAHRDGGYLARIDQDARRSDGWSRLVEVRMGAEGQVERLLIRHVYESDEAEFKQMRTDYVFDSNTVLVSRDVDGGDREHTEIALAPKTYVRLFDFNLFWGGALRRAQADDVTELPVFVPFHKPKLPVGKVVIGALPAIKDVSRQTLKLGQNDLVVTRYRTGGDRVIDVDEHGIAIQVLNGRMAQRDIITDYAHR